MKISWILLTYNRDNSVEQSIRHNLDNMGIVPGEVEIVWCDNGSRDNTRNVVRHLLNPDIEILNQKNLGVAKGYNAAMSQARGDFIVITGCDMLMPYGWLEKMYNALVNTPKAGIITVYASPISTTKERVRGPIETINGVRMQPAMPIGRRILSRELQREIGYFHEGFGMYGWDDVFWGHRAEKVCDEKGLRYLNLIDEVAEHLGTEGNVGYDHKDEHEYWKWKKEQVDDPAKQKLLSQLKAEGWPKFSPY